LEDQNLIELPPEMNRLVDASVMKFVVETLQPLTIVESEAFREIFHNCGINYIPTCRPTLKTKLEEIYEADKTKVKLVFYFILLTFKKDFLFSSKGIFFFDN
jgi:hypothetical protein